MKKFISFLAAGGALLVPFLAAAQAQAQTLETIGFTVLRILNIVLLIILALAFIYFVMGVINYMIGKEAEDKAKARSQMIYGIIGLFVIFSAWGLVRILQNTIGTTGGGFGICPSGYVNNSFAGGLCCPSSGDAYAPGNIPGPAACFAPQI